MPLSYVLTPPYPPPPPPPSDAPTLLLARPPGATVNPPVNVLCLLNTTSSAETLTPPAPDIAFVHVIGAAISNTASAPTATGAELSCPQLTSVMPSEISTEPAVILPSPASVSLPLPVTENDSYSTSTSASTVSVQSSLICTTYAPPPGRISSGPAALPAYVTARAKADTANARVVSVSRSIVLLLS